MHQKSIEDLSALEFIFWSQMLQGPLASGTTNAAKETSTTPTTPLVNSLKKINSKMQALNFFGLDF